MEKLLYKDDRQMYFFWAFLICVVVGSLITLLLSVWIHPFYGLLIAIAGILLIWNKKKKSIFFLDFYETYFEKTYYFSKESEKIPYSEIAVIEDVQRKSTSNFNIHLKKGNVQFFMSNNHKLYVLFCELSEKHGFKITRKFTSIHGK